MEPIGEHHLVNKQILKIKVSNIHVCLPDGDILVRSYWVIASLNWFLITLGMIRTQFVQRAWSYRAAKHPSVRVEHWVEDVKQVYDIDQHGLFEFVMVLYLHICMHVYAWLYLIIYNLIIYIYSLGAPRNKYPWTIREMNGIMDI